jgi:hypothetical protein
MKGYCNLLILFIGIIAARQISPRTQVFPTAPGHVRSLTRLIPEKIIMNLADVSDIPDKYTDVQTEKRTGKKTPGLAGRSCYHLNSEMN